ncbi:MAG TPA: hypothetical protein VGK94_15425 [Candidatus Polarisedimenticolia bacterium]|jgi:hypothetical protein
MLEDVQDDRISVLIVWEPVLWSDLYPPTSSVLSRVTDRRAAQFWDETRSLSKYMVRSAIENPSLLSQSESIPPDTVVWDFVAVFPAGGTWNPLSRPSYYGGPVVEVIDQVRSTLSSSPP